MAPESPKNPLLSPFDLESDDGYVWLKGNVHTHTSNSDGKVPPQERLDGYVKQGYDFLCLSDHRKITRIDAVSAPDDFTLIQGAELHPENPFGGQVHHFVALNIDEDMDSGAMPPQHVIDRVKEQGGSIWLAHPHWSSVNILRDTVPLSGLAGLEVFNSTCRRHGRGESSVHWDDWMALEDRLYPAIATDDTHCAEEDRLDTYQGWTMVRTQAKTPEAILTAMETGLCYSSNGPEIRNIQLRRVDKDGDKHRLVEASIECSEARRIYAVSDSYGAQYHEHGATFESATLAVRPNSRWVRFEVVGPQGEKAWSNPFDLTRLERS
jgi:hypothetical protein